MSEVDCQTVKQFAIASYSNPWLAPSNRSTTYCSGPHWYCKCSILQGWIVSCASTRSAGSDLVWSLACRPSSCSSLPSAWLWRLLCASPWIAYFSANFSLSSISKAIASCFDRETYWCALSAVQPKSSSWPFYLSSCWLPMEQPSAGPHSKEHHSTAPRQRLKWAQWTHLIPSTIYRHPSDSLSSSTCNCS